MVLFDNIIEIFSIADNDGRLMSLVVVRNGCGIGLTLIDRDFLRHPLAANGLAQEGLCGVPIAIGSQQKINRVALFIDGTVQIRPLSFDFYVGLIHPAAATTGYWRRRNRFSISGAYLMTQRLSVE